MIARVVPITRLPAHIAVFDYVIPPSLTVSVGDVVMMRFRHIACQGVVESICETSDFQKVLPLDAVLFPGAFSSLDIERLKVISRCIGQSLATLLRAALPRMVTPSSKEYRPLLPSSVSPRISQKEQEALRIMRAHIFEAEKKHETLALQGDFETGIALAHILTRQQAPASQILILVPRDRDATHVARALSSRTYGILTGTTKESERSALFSAWCTGKLPVLITTKQGSLWPAPLLTHVLVLLAGNNEYGSARRNPKFDPREAARLLALHAQATYVSIDTFPRIEDAADQTYGHSKLDDQVCYASTAISPPLFISLKNREEKTAYPLITASLLAEITLTLQKRQKVLLFLNRKGSAKRIQCKGCGHIPLCGTCGNIPTVRVDDLLCERCGSEMWLPEQCPACAKAKIGLVGVGGSKITHDLSLLFPHHKVTLIEKGHDADWQTADILVATEHIFANLLVPFTRYGFGLVADLMADLPIGDVNFRATEYTARHLLRLSSLALREHAQCLIQTWLPERLPHFIATPFLLSEELRLRKAYQLPPFGTIYTTSTNTLRNPSQIPSDPFTYEGIYR